MQISIPDAHLRANTKSRPERAGRRTEERCFSLGSGYLIEDGSDLDELFCRDTCSGQIIK